MLLHTFHQSIAHLNDSNSFESSFEVKYIPTTTTTHNVEQRCLSQTDREALMRFVQEFEALQTYSNSAKSTPKKSPYRKQTDNTLPACDSIISGNTSTARRSLTQSPEAPPVIRDHTSANFWSSHGDFLMDNYKDNNSSLNSTRSNSPVLLRSNMGCKSLSCCEYPEGDIDEEGVELMDSNQNSSADSSFDMLPPLLPTFHVTPPPKPSRSAAYELARFLRGSFHVKRAKITNLQRSVSVTEAFQSNQSSEVKPKTAVKSNDTCGKAQKNVVENTTNQANGNTRIFPNSPTSPFRRVWEQSSLRSPRSDKYTLSPAPLQTKNPEQRCSTSMLATDNDVFLVTDGKDVAAKRHHILPLRSHSDKVTANPRSKSPRVDSWGISFEHLLEDAAGLATFAEFLKMEFSAENIYFWTSCERYRTTESLVERQQQAKQIFGKYISISCSEPVNLDAHSRNISAESLQSAERDLFVRAQKQIFHLMKFDSYQRFIRSDLYKNCQNAEERNQPLPYGAENLDVLLKTNFLQNASPKLKKSASNAEDRRRKILLPWHRKTRSKSRDRMDVASDENPESSDGSSSALNTLLVPPCKLGLLTKSTENCDSQSLRSSLPTSLNSLNSACSLCRVKFCDGATTIVQTKPNETVGQLVERLLEKRGLRYTLYDVVRNCNGKPVDLLTPSQEIAGEEVEIEQRVTFKLYLPDPKVISVKSKPKKYLHEVVRPILHKYNYDIETVDVLKRDTMERLDLTQLVTTVDGQRLNIVLRKVIAYSADYQNDNITSHYMKSKELATEFIARNAKSNIKTGSVSSSQDNLDDVTNNLFQNIIKEKTHPDQYSLKSDECGSEISVFFETLNSKKGSNSISNLRQRGKNATPIIHHATDINIVTNELNKPIIAKLKAGVKLQVTERVAEKQDELLISLKSHFDKQSTGGMNISDLTEHARNKENQSETALALRHIRSNLSPVTKANPQAAIHFNAEPAPTPLERPPHTTTRNSITLKRNSILANDDAASNHSESEETSAASKGPPPLPPKPKVLPTKPSNWGANNSD